VWPEAFEYLFRRHARRMRNVEPTEAALVSLSVQSIKCGAHEWSINGCGPHRENLLKPAVPVIGWALPRARRSCRKDHRVAPMHIRERRVHLKSCRRQRSCHPGLRLFGEPLDAEFAHEGAHLEPAPESSVALPDTIRDPLGDDAIVTGSAHKRGFVVGAR
jgi:hypothetical protein